MTTTDFLLKFWGQEQTAASKLIPHDAVLLHDDAWNVWFTSPDQRARFVALLHERGLCVVTASADGALARVRTVAVYTLEKDGASWHLEYDFGYGYESDAARYMFEEGNYACDCNRSYFIQASDSAFPEHPCGHTIELTRFDVEYRE